MFGTIYQHNRCMILSHKLKCCTALFQKKRAQEQALLCQMSRLSDLTQTGSIALSKGFVPITWEQCYVIREHEL